MTEQVSSAIWGARATEPRLCAALLSLREQKDAPLSVDDDYTMRGRQRLAQEFGCSCACGVCIPQSGARAGRGREFSLAGGEGREERVRIDAPA